MTDMPSKRSKKSVDPDAVSDVEQLLRQLAHALKQAYVFERRAFELRRKGRPSHYQAPRSAEEQQASEYPESKARASQWVKIARKLMACRVNPVDYVHRIFVGLQETAISPPTPGALISERWIKYYQRRAKVDKKEISQALRTQKQVAKINIGCYQSAEVSMQEATLMTLFDESLPLSALFRYCLAYRMKNPAYARVLALYRVEAVFQYIRSAEEYDRTWKDFIPPDFAQLAERLYREYFA